MNNILEINVNNILHNLKILSKNKEVLIPVKANAYGLGYNIVDYLIDAGYKNFGVSTVEEAICVRKKSSSINILLFGSVFKEDINILKENNIIITVYDFDILEYIDSSMFFHLKIDLGMGRLGFLKEDLNKVLSIIKEKDLNIKGVYTHLPATYNKFITQSKIKEFESIVNVVKENVHIEYVHYANGVGALIYDTHFDNLVRPGLVTYGYLPTKDLASSIGRDIKPSLTLKSKIGSKKEYSGYVGYDQTQEYNGVLGVISLGYHDGLKMSFQGYEIKGIGKFIGKICMCQSMLALSNKNLQKGDVVEIFSSIDDSLYDLSKYSNVTIYEIIATLGNRIKRKYIK